LHLPAQLPACSHDLSSRLRVNAESLIARRVGFGEGVGVDVQRRSPRVPRWRSLGEVRGDLLSELDLDRNERVEDLAAIASRSKRKLWWRCSHCAHQWEATVGSRVAGHGCPACARDRVRGPRTVAPERSLAATHPELLSEWDDAGNAGVDPASIGSGSKYEAWWRCASCARRWQAAVYNRTAGHGCPVCGMRRRARARSEVPYDRSLAALRPDLVAELDRLRNHEIDPDRLGARSTLTLWWRCSSCGHEWRATVASRAGRGTGCPRCGLDRRARTQSQVSRERSLAVRYPGVAAELHLTRNPGIDSERLGARSSLKLWWRCSRGHEWRTTVATRTSGSGCPTCYLQDRQSAKSQP
jgi:rubrerythrin